LLSIAHKTCYKQAFFFVQAFKVSKHMNKQQLIASMSRQLQQSQRQTKIELEQVLASIKQALIEGEKIFLPQFGTFELSYRLPKIARHPQTGASIEVEGQNVPRIKFSPNLKVALNPKAL
jgi:DNA-binding protein HU-alpha